MRKIIVYISILIILTLSVIYKSDYFRVEITELSLKNNLDSAAKGASMLVDEERFGEGYIVFKDTEIQEYVDKILNKNCDKYEIHIFDDSGTHRKYDNKGLLKKENFSYTYSYTDPQGLNSTIEYPAIIIEGQIEKEFYRFTDLQNKKQEVVRSSMYLVEGRDT